MRVLSTQRRYRGGWWWVTASFEAANPSQRKSYVPVYIIYIPISHACGFCAFASECVCVGYMIIYTYPHLPYAPRTKGELSKP